MPKYQRALAIDAGTQNCGICIVQRRGTSFVPVYIEMLQETISDLTANYGIERQSFRRKMRKLIKIHQPDVIVVERFQNRGRFRGSSGEKISVMIGVLSNIADNLGVDIELVTAATWKNRFNFNFDNGLPLLYEKMKPMVPHLIDAYLIGVYILNREEKRLNPYAGWKSRQLQPMRKLYVPKKRGKHGK